MVRAILAGRKTQTRRLVNDRLMKLFRVAAEIGEVSDFLDSGTLEENDPSYIRGFSPFGQPGDRLWVRETWRPFEDAKLGTCIKYQADGARIKPTAWTEDQGAWCEAAAQQDRWRPSIHLPRWACRLVLEVTAVRVARLREIDRLEVAAEGIIEDGPCRWRLDEPHSPAFQHARDAFAHLWNSIHSKPEHRWPANPWVWIVTFRRVAGEGHS